MLQPTIVSEKEVELVRGARFYFGGPIPKLDRHKDIDNYRYVI